MAPFGLDDDVWQSVMEGVVRGSYSLLLGAGASFGAVNGLGNPVPMGGELAAALQAHYSIPTPPAGTGLRSVYDLSESAAKRLRLETPASFLGKKFSGCTCPAWYENLVKVPWQIIWTLNIDDVLEDAYLNKFKAAARQKLRPVSWDSRNIFHREPADDLTAVHLHGRAGGNNLVFGSMEYLAGVQQAGSAHRLFWDSWATAPVIVVGATLADEIDLAAPLSDTRSTGHGEPPSLVVLPSTVSDFDKYRLDATGLTIVQAKAEEFFAAVAEYWAPTVAALGGNIIEETDGINPNHSYFLRHFRDVAKTSDRSHDFFKGDEPTFTDIGNKMDAKRALSVLDNYRQKMGTVNKLSVVAFVGTLSGATTAELRFLYDCQQQGYTVSEFDSDAAFNVGSLVWAAKRNSKLVLRIKDLDDFAAELERLRSIVKEADVPLQLVTTVRAPRLPILEAALLDSLTSVSITDTLRDAEINELIQTLERHDRLTSIKMLNASDRRDFFRVSHRRHMFDALADLSKGRGFAGRVMTELEAARHFGNGSLADIVLISAEIGYPIPISIVSRAIGIGAPEVRAAVEGGRLSGLAIIERDMITSRQRTLTSRVSNQTRNTDLRFTVAQSLAMALAPYQNPRTITQRTRPTRIISQLMDADRIYDWFGKSRTDEWYQTLYDDYSWNSRYWEQRALAEAVDANPRWEMAHSWATEAVSRNADAYSLHTLGNILIRRALSERQLDLDLFYIGLNHVDEATQKAKRPSEHTYVTALSSLRKGYTHASVNDAERARIRGSFNRWTEDARHSAAWAIPTAQSAILAQVEKFFQNVVEE